MRIRNKKKTKLIAAMLCLVLVGVVAAHVLSNYSTMYVTVTESDFQLSVDYDTDIWVEQTSAFTLNLTAPDTLGYSGTFNISVSIGNGSRVLIMNEGGVFHNMTDSFSVPFDIPVGSTSILADFWIKINTAGQYQILIFAHVMSVDDL